MNYFCTSQPQFYHRYQVLSRSRYTNQHSPDQHLDSSFGLWQSNQLKGYFGQAVVVLRNLWDENLEILGLTYSCRAQLDLTENRGPNHPYLPTKMPL